jgi:hypothetical protein
MLAKASESVKSNIILDSSGRLSHVTMQGCIAYSYFFKFLVAGGQVGYKIPHV